MKILTKNSCCVEIKNHRSLAGLGARLSKSFFDTTRNIQYKLGS